MISYIINLIYIYFFKKYYPNGNKFFNLFIKNYLEKTNKINLSDRIEILKDKYNIESTEKTKIKTNPNIKCIVKKPQYIKTNKLEKYVNTLSSITKSNTFIKKELENILNQNPKPNYKNNIQLIETYIYNKKNFIKLFFNPDNTCKFINLETFYIFYKKYSNSKIKFNILLKFYNPYDYQYIYMNDNNLTKIISNTDYDVITNLIETNNNIFLIQSKETLRNNKSINFNYISHGDYIDCKINKKELKNIFFSNTDKSNKNYQLLSKFNNLTIFFYISTLIS